MSQIGDPKQVTLIIAEIDGDGKEIGRNSIICKYKYGSKVVEIVSPLIGYYEKYYNVELVQDDIQVYAIGGSKQFSMDEVILEGDTGTADPRLKITLRIQSKASKAQSTQKREDKAQEVSLVWTEKYSDNTEREHSDYKLTCTCESQVIALKSQIIQHYNNSSNQVIAPEDIIIKNMRGKQLDSSTRIFDEVDKEKPTLMVNVRVNAQARTNEKLKIIDIVLVEQYGDGTVKERVLRSIGYKPKQRAKEIKAHIVSAFYAHCKDAISVTITNVDGIGLQDDDLLVDENTLVKRPYACLHVLVLMSSKSSTVSGDGATEDKASKQLNSTEAKYDNSSDETTQVGDDVTSLFINELNLKKEDMERLLPLLASMTICTMSSLLGASVEQITALKLKPITTKRLQKLLEAKRGSSSPTAVPTATHKSSTSSIADVTDENAATKQEKDDDIDFKEKEDVLIATEKEASLEELVIQKKDCAEKMHMLIALQTSCQLNPIESRLDKARSYLSSRVTRLSRLIQEREAQGREKQAMGTVPTDPSMVAGSSSSWKKYEASQVTSILRSPASKSKGRAISLALTTSVREFSEGAYNTYVDYEKREEPLDVTPTETVSEAPASVAVSPMSYADVTKARSYVDTRPTPTSDTWFCSYPCKKITTVTAYNACIVCRYPAMKLDSRTSTEAGTCAKPTTRHDTWYCNSITCGRTTHVDATGSCLRCNHKAIRAPSLPRDWKCAYCYRDNNPTNSRCYKCTASHDTCYCGYCAKITNVFITGKCTSCYRQLVSALEASACSVCCKRTTVFASGKCEKCYYNPPVYAGHKPSVNRAWKCSYCDKMDNDSAMSKCSNCAQERYVVSSAHTSQGIISKAWFPPYVFPY